MQLISVLLDYGWTVYAFFICMSVRQTLFSATLSRYASIQVYCSLKRLSLGNRAISRVGRGRGRHPKFPARKIFASPSPGQIYYLPAGFPVPKIFNFAYKTYLNTLCMKYLSAFYTRIKLKTKKVGASFSTILTVVVLSICGRNFGNFINFCDFLLKIFTISKKRQNSEKNCVNLEKFAKIRPLLARFCDQIQ